MRKNDLIAALFISIMLIFINPYYVIFIAALVNIKFAVNKSIAIPAISLGLAFFWASRNIGVTWDGGADDLIQYLNIFIDQQSRPFLDIMTEFMLSPKGHEPVYLIYAKIAGIVTSNESVFIFTTYLIIALLTFLAAVVTNENKYLIVIAVFMFGIGGFAEQTVLHLWRSAIASIAFYIGVVSYVKGYAKLKWMMLLACLTHIIAVLPTLLFFIIAKLKCMNNFFGIFATSLILAVTIQYFGLTLVENYIPGIVLTYFSTEYPLNLMTYIPPLLVSILYFIKVKRKLNIADSLTLLFALFTFIFALVLPISVGFLGRFGTFVVLFYNLHLFGIMQRYSIFLAPVIVLLFLRKMLVINNSTVYNSMMPDVINIFKGLWHHI